MTTQHTPGPWAVNYTKFSEVKASNGALVATCNKLNGFVNLQANARLIAAAPELLEALQNLLKSKCIDGDIALEAKSAIAKATGKTTE